VRQLLSTPSKRFEPIGMLSWSLVSIKSLYFLFSQYYKTTAV
jgi:hypothetical protein